MLTIEVSANASDSSEARKLCLDFGNALVTQNSTLASSFDLERQKLLELDETRKVLREYQRLEENVSRRAVRDIITRVAQCLPGECRLDWCGLDTQSRLVLKGTMLQGDQSYEILKALRDLPEISEVALESVGNSSNLGRTSNLFEIHCEIAGQPAKSTELKTQGDGSARLTASYGITPR